MIFWHPNKYFSLLFLMMETVRKMSEELFEKISNYDVLELSTYQLGIPTLVNIDKTESRCSIYLPTSKTRIRLRYDAFIFEKDPKDVLIYLSRQSYCHLKYNSIMKTLLSRTYQETNMVVEKELEIERAKRWMSDGLFKIFKFFFHEDPDIKGQERKINSYGILRNVVEYGNHLFSLIRNSDCMCERVTKSTDLENCIVGTRDISLAYMRMIESENNRMASMIRISTLTD